MRTSGVGDAIDDLVGDFVLSELLLIDGLEVAWQTLCLDWVHYWGALLHALRRVGFDEPEILERLGVRGLEVEVSGNITRKFELARVGVLVQEFLHALQLLHLSLGVILLVRRSTVEGQLVVRVLRVLLMEDVVFAVIPVGEGGVVGAEAVDGLGGLFDFLVLRRILQALLTSEFRPVRRRHVHLVRVDDLGLLLKVEGLFVVLDLGLGELVGIVLLVV